MKYKEPKVINITSDYKDLNNFFELFGHELALSLKNAMQEESLSVDIKLMPVDFQEITYQFERIATAFEKIQEKLCK